MYDDKSALPFRPANDDDWEPVGSYGCVSGTLPDPKNRVRLVSFL
jgi:hypothetical protein